MSLLDETSPLTLDAFKKKYHSSPSLATITITTFPHFQVCERTTILLPSPPLPWIHSSTTKVNIHIPSSASFLPSIPCHGKIFFPADNLLFLLLPSGLAIPTVSWRNLFLFPTQARTRNTHTHAHTHLHLHMYGVCPGAHDAVCLSVSLSLCYNQSHLSFFFLSFLPIAHTFFVGIFSPHLLPSILFLCLFMARLPATSSCSSFCHLCVLCFVCVSFVFLSWDGQMPEGRTVGRSCRYHFLWRFGLLTSLTRLCHFRAA